MYYKVYKISGKDNVVKYIGITKSTLKKRLYKHRYDVINNRTKNLHKISWFKDNINSINIELIEEVYDVNTAFEREKYWISFYRDKGVNLINKTDGGEGCYGYKHSKETIKSMSGKNNHRWGKKNLINKEKLGRKIEYSEDGKNWVLFDSIRETESTLNISFRSIKNICDGNYTIFTNYFRYYGQKFKYKRERKKNDQSIRKIKVEVFINGEWLTCDSAKDASDLLNIDRTKIVMVCNGKRLTTSGLKFRYKGHDYKGVIKKTGNPGRKIKFKYNEEIYEFNSITEASKELNVSRKKIYKLL